ncbi:MAG: hypothetical protein VCA34_05455, partial [Roseibacillus sp.]
IGSLPDPVIDLGTIANANEPFQINTFSNDLTFDTQLALYDSAGALTAENDDANGTLQSALDFPGGLAPGTWFIALGGYPTFYGDFFYVAVNTNINTTSEGGPYMLNHPLGIVDEAIVSSRHQWFQFEVAPPPTLPSIDITRIAFNPATNEFTLSWETSLPGPFNIFMGTAAEFAALQPAPNNVLPTAAAAGVSSPVTIPVPGGLQGAPQLLIQVTE